MSTQETTDSLLDVLFDELEDEQRAEALDEVAKDPELQAEYAAFERMLGDIDRELVDEEPPEHVHEAHMASARQHVRDSVEDRTRVEPRSPTNGASSRGFWGRMASSNSGQIALVATVLLVGAFVFKVVDVDRAPMPGSMPLEEGSMPSIVSDQTPTDLVEPIEEGGESAVTYEAEASPEPLAEPQAEEREVAQEGIVARRQRAGSQDADGRGRAELGEPKADSDKAAESGRTVSASNTKPKAALKKERAPAQRRAPRAPVEQSGVDSSGAVPTGSVPSTDDAEAANKGLDDDGFAALEDVVGAEEKSVYQPPSGTIAAVEESYSRGDYRATVREADKVLESKVSQTQKARALELKAQSYRKMNQLTQADAIYRNIQTNFPDYSPRRIRQARSEIQRIQSQQRAPKPERRKAAPQKSQESMESFDNVY